jgi:hypothetical protein
MSDKLNTAILKEAEEKAKEEFRKQRVLEVQDALLEILKKQEEIKKEKALIAEKERILKLDYEDIRQGNFEKVKERHEKSKIAKDCSVEIPDSLLKLTKVVRNSGTTIPQNAWWGVDNFTPAVYYSSSVNNQLGSVGSATTLNNASYTLTATSGGWLELSSGTYDVNGKNFYLSATKIL